jgi:hypothetical protein
MIQVDPITLEFNGVRLEPLGLAHADGLRAAACDGELWNLRITSVPEPQDVEAYIRLALDTPNRLAFAVIDAASGAVMGTTSYHDIVPNIDRVEIGWTWYAKSRQRSHVNTSCKLLLLSHAFDTLGCAWSACAPITSTTLRRRQSNGWARAGRRDPPPPPAPRRHRARHGHVQHRARRMARDQIAAALQTAPGRRALTC